MGIMGLTTKEKEMIEKKILEFRSPFEGMGCFKFIWQDDTVKFKGSIYVDKKRTLEVPQLVSVGGDVRIEENSQLKASQLKTIKYHLIVKKNAILYAPELLSVGESIYAYSENTIELPKLETVKYYINVCNTILKVPNLKAVGCRIRVRGKHGYVFTNENLKQRIQLQ